MKRSTKLALSLVLAAGTIAPAFAQDNFPDVPANHWAYEALARMKKDGLLVGYPDGLFRGGRPASRYELAVAMHAVYTNLKNVTDGLDAQIQAIKGAGYASQSDVQALKDAITQLQNDLNAMRGYGDDIAALKRAAETFDKELKSLGVDVESMKKDLTDIAGRVQALENKKPAIEISGDVNLLVLAGSSTGRRVGLSEDGRFEGLSNSGTAVGLVDDFNVFHEGAFTFTSTKTTGPKFTGTAVIGNMLGGESSGTSLAGNNFGTQSTLPIGRYNDSGADDIYLQNLEASFAAMAFGVGFNIELGRLNHKVDEYMFQRPDTTSYFSNDRWDNGKYTFDGGLTSFKIFGANLTAFGGRNSGRASNNGVDINPVVLGNNRVAGNSLGAGVLGTSSEGTVFDEETLNASGVVDRSLGLQAAIPFTKIGNLNLAYLWLDADGPSDFNVDARATSSANLLNVPGANRLEVFGGDVNFTFGRFKVLGGLRASDLNHDSSEIVSTNNVAFNAKAAFAVNKFDLYAEYREIGQNYVAPGDWGRLGILRNPGNIHGWNFGGAYNISNKLVLSGKGEIDKGLNVHGGGVYDPTLGGATGNVFTNAFDGGTEINNYAIRIDFKVNPNLGVFGSYEDTRFSGLNIATPTSGDSAYRFTTLGMNYGLSETAKINLSYQVSDVRNEAFLGTQGLTTDGRYKGGLLTTQLTVKF